MTSKGIDGGWDTLGVARGKKVPDMTLYSTTGERFRLYDELHRGKPLVIFNASYTCDVSRGNLPGMKKIAAQYQEKANFYVVYTIEPHPADAGSPYAKDDQIWLSNNNIRDTIQANQPKTYGERVNLSAYWKDHYQITPTVLVDDPENSYWATFGQAPNMAYVIEPDGTVYYKQAWFREDELAEEIEMATAE